MLHTIWKGYGGDDISCVGSEPRRNEAGRGKGEAMEGIGLRTSCCGRGRGIMIQKCGDRGARGLYGRVKAKTHSLELKKRWGQWDGDGDDGSR